MRRIDGKDFVRICVIVGQAAAKTVVREGSGARIVNENDDVGAGADCAARGVRGAVRWHGSCRNRFVNLAKDEYPGVGLKRGRSR